MKFSKIEIKGKGKKSLMKVYLTPQKEVSMEGNAFNSKLSKESDQFMSKALMNATIKLVPHLLYGSKMITGDINLDGELDYEAWFNQHQFLDDERFEDVEITKVQFSGTEVLEGVKLFGHRIMSWGNGKDFKVKFETPVLTLDRMVENGYPLCSLLDAHVDDFVLLVTKWYEGETLSKAQQAELFDEVNIEAAAK